MEQKFAIDILKKMTPVWIYQRSKLVASRDELNWRRAEQFKKATAKWSLPQNKLKRVCPRDIPVFEQVVALISCPRGCFFLGDFRFAGIAE